MNSFSLWNILSNTLCCRKSDTLMYLTISIRRDHLAVLSMLIEVNKQNPLQLEQDFLKLRCWCDEDRGLGGGLSDQAEVVMERRQMHKWDPKGRRTEEHRDIKKNDWTTAMMSAWSLTVWESGIDVKNSRAVKHPGKQLDEGLEILLIELKHKLLNVEWS